MTRNDARAALNTSDATIARNVDDYFAGRISHEEFGRRQRAAHDAIKAAGQSDAWRRRWRQRNPISGR